MTLKILSLDGDGIRGVISATILKEIEKIIKADKQQGLHEYFDLIAGTSTSSILAAGIACELSAEQMIDLYNQDGHNIFLQEARQRRQWQKLTQLLANKLLYPHEQGEQGLAKVLKKALDNSPLSENMDKSLTLADINQPQLLLLAYDILSRNTTWFATDDPQEWYYQNQIELWEICTAAASAPTFFPPYKILYNFEEKEYLPYIDGGVSANNSTLAAIAHALSMQTGDENNPMLQEIAILSIGTGMTTRPDEYEEIKKWGLINWGMKIPNIFLHPSAQNSEYISVRLLKSLESENYLRLNLELNEQCQVKSTRNGLRKRLEQPYNQYILQSIGEKREISEDIDNLDNCKDLIGAAECYLDCGKVFYQEKMLSVREAIHEFIRAH
ncbi:MAG: patatin [Symploca sp. SIO2C1]|nr:patatin [Symploca sp. SIO2C1]